MEDYEDARRLISAARKDLRALTGMEDTHVFAEEVFGFHAQQAIEKALKARLSLAGIEYPKSHDISLLLSMLLKYGVLTEDYTDLLEFNPYAVQFRYEAFDETGEPLNRSAVIRRVTEVIEATQQMIDDYPHAKMSQYQ